MCKKLPAIADTPKQFKFIKDKFAKSKQDGTSILIINNERAHTQATVYDIVKTYPRFVLLKAINRGYQTSLNYVDLYARAGNFQVVFKGDKLDIGLNE